MSRVQHQNTKLVAHLVKLLELSVTQNYWNFLNTTKSHLHSHLHISFSAFYLPFFLYKLPASVTSHSSLFGQVPVLFWDRSHLEQSSAPCVKPVLQCPVSWGNKYSVVLDAIPAGVLEPGERGGEQNQLSGGVLWSQPRFTGHSFPQWVSTGWSLKVKSHFHKLMLLRPHVLIFTLPKT